jgi:hypothetical protein
MATIMGSGSIDFRMIEDRDNGSFTRLQVQQVKLPMLNQMAEEYCERLGVVKVK